MSLKEELIKLFEENRCQDKWIINEILSIFEKRIDKMIQVAEEERITREPFPFGRIATLKEVKEMLK